MGDQAAHGRSMPDQSNRKADEETAHGTNPELNALHVPFQAEQYQAGAYFGQGSSASTHMVRYGYLQYFIAVDLTL